MLVFLIHGTLIIIFIDLDNNIYETLKEFPRKFIILHCELGWNTNFTLIMLRLTLISLSTWITISCNLFARFRDQDNVISKRSKILIFSTCVISLLCHLSFLKMTSWPVVNNFSDIAFRYVSPWSVLMASVFLRKMITTLPSPLKLWSLLRYSLFNYIRKKKSYISKEYTFNLLRR